MGRNQLWHGGKMNLYTLQVFPAALSVLCLIELVVLRDGTLLAAAGICPTIQLLLPQLRFVKKLLLMRTVS